MPFVMGGQFEHLPPWYQALIKSTMEATEAARKQTYPGSGHATIADITPMIKQSYDQLKQFGGQDKYLKEAAALMRSPPISYADQLEPYMNPYTKNVIKALSEEGGRTFKEQIMPALEAKFVGLGQHGSSRHRGMAERMGRDLQNEILRKQQEAMYQGHSMASQLHHQGQMRNLEMGRGLANIGLAGQKALGEDISLMNAMGSQQQAHRQNELNELQAQHWRQQMWPHQQLAQQASILHGMPIPSMGNTNMAYEPPQAIPQLNRVGNMGGMAAQMYGMNQMRRGFKKGGHIGISSLRFVRRKKRKN